MTLGLFELHAGWATFKSGDSHTSVMLSAQRWREIGSPVEINVDIYPTPVAAPKEQSR